MMNIQVLAETDVRRIIREELDNTVKEATHRVRAGSIEAEPAQSELQTVRIAFSEPSGHIEQYMATPDVARQIADDFVGGRKTNGSYLVKRVDKPCILALNFSFVLRID